MAPLDMYAPSGSHSYTVMLLRIALLVEKGAK